MKKTNKWFFAMLGLTAGILNGLFGAGGGIVVVPLLEKADIEPQKAHATSICIILVLSIISTVVYWKNGNIPFVETLYYIPAGLIGAIAGAFLLKKISNDLLKRIFGIVIVISGIRLLLK